MDVFGHASYILYLASYIVRDILWLRLLSIVAGLCLYPFFYFREEVMWVSLGWITLFNLVNVYQCVVLILERRPVGMSGEEQHLYHHLFSSMNARTFKKLVGLGRWKEAGEGDVLVSRGQSPESLGLLSSGELLVHVADGSPIEMHPGQFVGELAFITNDESSADVVAAGPSRYLEWPARILQDELDKGTEIGMTLQSVIGADVAAKLRDRNLRQCVR